MTPRPGRNSKIFDITLPRPRPLSLTTERRFFDIVAEIKATIYGDVQTATESGKYQIDTYAH